MPSNGWSPTMCPPRPYWTGVEMLEHPHFRERGTVIDGPDGRPASGPLVRFEQRPARPPYGAPAAGSSEPVWLPRSVDGTSPS